MRPSPPPPPPSPPRRAASPPPVAAIESEYDEQLEIPTAAGHQEPSTLNRTPETLPLEAALNPRRGRADVATVSFDDETQARPIDNGLLDKLRHAELAKAEADLGVDYESLPSLEVRRPYDTYEAEFSERDPVTQLHRDAREAPEARAPRGEHDSAEHRVDARRQAPTYEDTPRHDTPYQEPSYQEPSYQEPEVVYREPEPSYQEPSYPAPAAHGHKDPGDPDYWGRREESGPRERPVAPPPARSYAAPVPAYDDASDSAQWGRDRAEPHAPDPDASMIPPAPRLPDDMDHPAFAQGVQPIRTATPDAWGTPHAAPPAAGPYLPSPMQAIHSSMPPGYAQAQQQPHYPPPQAYPNAQGYHAQASHYPHAQQHAAGASGSYLPQGQRHLTPAPMHSSAMPPAMQSMQIQAQPGAQLAQAPASGKVGRFAWFVAGAAFGITFAFFATGFFNGGKLGTKDEGAAAPALTAPAAIAPAAPVAVASPGVAPVATALAAPVAPALTAPVAAGVAAPAVPAPAALPGALPSPALVAPPVAAAAPTAPPHLAFAPAPPPPARQAPPPPRAPRVQPPRRPSAPATTSAAPRNLNGGGPGADDVPSAPSAPAGGGDISDLLGAGLKP